MYNILLKKWGKTVKILVVGLGLIGASIAKSLKKNTSHYIMGWNRTESVMDMALADGAVDEIGTLKNLIPKADITIINFYSDAIVPFVIEHRNEFKKGSIVTDSCGIKTEICRTLEKENFNFTYIGAHPMAGREVSGYENSLADLFENASFICTPVNAPKSKTDTLVELAKEMKFARTVVTTPEHHDEMIAFTSQIAHVLACSYVLSPLAPYHDGFSAGSYRDVSRVARINYEMWSKIFIANKKPLIDEIDDLVCNLEKFRAAIDDDDENKLNELMSKANRIKEEIG